MRSYLFIIFVLNNAAFADPQERLPVPKQTALDDAYRQVRELFATTLDQKMPEQLVAAAKELIDTADQSKDDPAIHYALLDSAIKVTPDVQQALRAAARLSDTYKVDPLKTEYRAIQQVSRRAKTASEHEMVAKAYEALMLELAADDRYEIAARIAELAVSAAQRARNRDLVVRIRPKIYEYKKAKVAYEKVEAAFVSLKTNPKDTKANLVAGSFLCFLRNDWNTGLPMLALSDDEVLKPLAIQELKSPEAGADQLKLADGWYSAASRSDEESKLPMLIRSALWYRRALSSQPPLGGLKKVKAEKRLSSLADQIDPQALKANEKAAPPPRKTLTSDPIAIDVRRPWPFAMRVKKGETIEITATGRWRILPRGRWHGPDAEVFYFAGRLGAGEHFKVGSNYTLVVKEDSVLYLGIFEGGKYSNNNGNVTVVIKKTQN